MTAQARRERFETVAAEVLEPVRRYLARRTDRAGVDDVLAETLLVCWRRLDEVPEAPLPWVLGVARLCLANAQRGARRQQRVARRVAALDPPVATAPAPGEEGPAQAQIRAALAALPGRDAELLRLWAWEQLAPAEIAVVLDISPNAASIRLHRARGKLRVQLRKDGAAAGHGGVREGRTP